MKIVIYTNAGCFSQTLVYLSWCVYKSNDDKIYYYYYDKYERWDDPKQREVNEGNNLIYNFIEKLNLLEEDFKDADIKTHCWPNLHTKYPEFFNSDTSTCGGISQNSKIFFDSRFNDIRKLFNIAIKENFIFRKDFVDKIQIRNSIMFNVINNKQKIFCVMIRTPLHYNKNTLNISELLNEIEIKSQGYDYILPITIVKDYYEAIKDKFKEKTIETQRPRIGILEDWFTNKKYGDALYEEVELVLEDVYLASKCDYVLGSSSNLFLATLFFNLDIQYDIITELKGINGS